MTSLMSRFLLVAFIGWVSSLVAQSLEHPYRGTSSDRLNSTRCLGSSKLRWSPSGFFVRIEKNQARNPTVCIENSDGMTLRDISIPDAGFVQLYDAIVPEPNLLIFCGRALSDDSQPMTFVAWATGEDLRLTRTWPYFPVKAVRASDQSVWTMGWLENEEYTKTISRFQIRRFSREGSLLNVFSPALPPGSWPENSHLAVAGDRIALFTNTNRYIEFDLVGNELVRREGPPNRPDSKHYTGFGVSQAGWAAVSYWRNGVGEVWCFKGRDGEWRKLDLTPGGNAGGAEVFGFESEDLTVGVPDGRPNGKTIYKITIDE
jgi:hypothetical protein